MKPDNCNQTLQRSTQPTTNTACRRAKIAGITKNHTGGECATVSINSRRPCGCNAGELKKMSAHILKIGPRTQRKMPKYNLENEYVCICSGIYRMVSGQRVDTLRNARTSKKKTARAGGASPTETCRQSSTAMSDRQET